MTDKSTELGWSDKPSDHPDVVAMRDYLEANNGIRGLQVLKPDEVEAAVRLFHRDGFVAVADILAEDQIKMLKTACEQLVPQIVAADENRIGNRGAQRYSFGGSSETLSLLHHPAWQMLLQVPAVDELVTAIFGDPNFILRAASGDFCLPGTVDYQMLHSDVHEWRKESKYSSFQDPSGRISLRDLPCPYLAVNFLPQDVTRLNGPTRQIPGTQNSRVPIPLPDDEPEWMRLSTVCPLPAGAIMIRDVRAWHGGTPNLTDNIRCIPNLEFYAPWFREPLVKSISYADHQKLSPRAQELTRFSVADSSENLVTGIKFHRLY